MLVVSRERDEVVVIGDGRTVMANLTNREELALRQCCDPALLDLAGRLLESMGRPVTCTVMEIGRDRTRLGFRAPREIPVHRREVAERIRAENAGQLK